MTEIYLEISKLTDKFRTMAYGLINDKNKIHEAVQELMLYFMQMNPKTLKAIYDKDGIDEEKLAYVMEIKNTKRGRISEYLDKYPNAEYPHVEHVEWHGYDMINYGEINEFNISKNKLIQSPDKLFVCYNRRQDIHRTLLIDQLEAHALLEKGVVTYKLHRPDLVDEEDFVLHTTPAIPEYGIDQFPRNYFKGLIDIVTESRWKPGEHYLSEKTFKPIAGLKPFLVLSAQGYHTWLERKGIKKYNIFDYSFDNEPKLEDRVEGIIQNLKRLDALYKTPEDYANVLKELEPDMQHNLDAYTTNIKNGLFLLNPILDYLKLYDPLKDPTLGGLLSGDSQSYFSELHTIILPNKLKH